MDDLVTKHATTRIAHGRLTVCVCVAVTVLSLSGGVAAAATSTNARAAKKAPQKVVKPGDPGSSQYQEDVPSAFGSVPATTVSSNLGHPSGPPLPHAVATQLGNEGGAGRAAAALAVAGSPQLAEPAARRSRHGSHPSVGGGGGSGGGSGSSGSAALAQAGSGRGIVGALVHSLVGSDSGVGALLPVLLGASVLLAAAFAMRRRRKGG
jgi:hypothetical protein